MRVTTILRILRVKLVAITRLGKILTCTEQHGYLHHMGSQGQIATVCKLKHDLVCKYLEATPTV
jgi:hypothetical protein